MPKKHTEATRLAAVVLVRHAGATVDDAAAALGVTPKAVRRWLTNTKSSGTGAWADLERMLLAMAADRSARGDVRNLTQILTAAGISSRNVRYGQLIAQRDTRRAAKVAEEDAEARRWRRNTILAEVDPTDTYQGILGDPDAQRASQRRERYLRAHHHWLFARLDGEDHWPDEPIVAEHLQPVGLYFLLRRAAENTPDDNADQRIVDTHDIHGVPDELKATTAELDAMSDEDYRAYYTRLVDVVQTEADAWWPHHTAELRKGCIAERRSDGTLRIMRNGRDVTHYTPMKQMPYEFEGIPVIDVGPELDAKDVTPPPRLETVEEPLAPAEPVRTHESFIADFGDRGWHPYYREDSGGGW